MSEDLTQAGAETPAEDQSQTPAEPTFEDRALTMGWTPKEQFKGDPDKFVDAETFVKRGEEFLPFVKANNKRLEAALDRQTKETEKLKTTLAQFSEHHSKTEAKAYERAMRELQGQIAASAAAGDVQGVMNATDELSELRAEAKAGNTAPVQADEPPELTEWKAENKWFGTDKALTAATIAMGEEAVSDGFSGKALIKEVDRRLKAEFPNKFENPNRKLPGAVEGSGAAPRRAGKTYSDLPPEAKSACDDFTKRIPGFTREQYVKDFFS